jgi:hypothetical protein
MTPLQTRAPLPPGARVCAFALANGVELHISPEAGPEARIQYTPVASTSIGVTVVGFTG